jgi:hypothetical protein
LLTKPLELRGVGLALTRRLLDPGRDLVLLSAPVVDPGVQLAAALVERQQLVEAVGRLASGEGLAGRPGVLANLLQVERGTALRRAWVIGLGARSLGPRDVGL